MRPTEVVPKEFDIVAVTKSVEKSLFKTFTYRAQIFIRHMASYAFRVGEKDAMISFLEEKSNPL